MFSKNKGVILSLLVNFFLAYRPLFTSQTVLLKTGVGETVLERIKKYFSSFNALQIKLKS
tara:strand:+ start:543 stop:722 length:180 start_codon:yes stop_codon:yes gene_type:complete